MSVRISVVLDLVMSLQKALDSKAKEEDPDVAMATTCTDLVDRLDEATATTAVPLPSPSRKTNGRRIHGGGSFIPEEEANKILRCLSSVSKSLRLLKRQENAAMASLLWAPLHERVSAIAERLKQQEQPAATDGTAAGTAVTSKSSSSSSSNEDKDEEGGRQGLPKTVNEYLDRLRRQKKDLYKNPPALPPSPVRVEASRAPPPTRGSHQQLRFEPGQESDASAIEFIRKFRPNQSPAQVLRGGAFGGTYFRPIVSAVTNEKYSSPKEVLKSTVLPEWIDGMDVKLQLTSSTYRNSVNRYGVKCGGSLGMWESSGWISDADPYGWFQWYCRFYQGRRCTDDARQISRWLGVAGPAGRFRTQLCNKILRASTSSTKSSSKADKWNDANISPVIRQTLVHWGLEITQDMVEAQAKRLER